MLKVSLRSLLANKGRFAMTAFAVVLGVAFVVGAFIVTDTVRVSFEHLFGEISGGVDVSVRATSDIESAGGPTSRGKIPDTLLPTVRGVDGVRSAEGSVGGYAQMLTPEGKPVTTTGAPFIGVSWGHDDSLFPATLIDGKKPAGPDEVAVDADTAKKYGLTPGTKSTVLLTEGPRPVEVVGVFRFGKSNSLLGARLTAFDTTSAQSAFGSVGQFDSIQVGAVDGVTSKELADRITKVLPKGVEAATRQEVVHENVDSLGQFIGIFQTVLLVFAGVSVFVSAFFINNTFSIVLGQRVRQLALLRALGASATQIRRSIALESLIVGVVASAIGIGAGMLVATGLKALLAAGGFDLPETGLVLETRTWIVALIVGIGVTMLASVLPGRRAATVQPVEGMREGVITSASQSRRRLVLGGVLTVLGATAMVLGLFVVDDTAILFSLLGVGAIAVFVGVASLSPLLAVPVVAVLGWPFQRWSRGPGRLARDNGMRNPTRTARTAAALMIGVALVAMVLVVGTSIKNSVSKAVEGSVRADYAISSDGFTGFSESVAQKVAALPSIAAASGVRQNRFKFEGKSEDLTGFAAPEGQQLFDIGMRSGSWNTGADGIFIHDDVAKDHNLKVGDPVTVEFASGGPQRFKVAGIYSDATFAGNYWIPLTTFARFYPTTDTDTIAFARVAEGVNASKARADIEKVLAAYPQLKLENRSEFRKSQEDQLNQILVSVNGLLLLAVVIALLGIANTLALSVLERTREIGLLRAVGMSRRQTRRMVRYESVLIAVFGAVLGLVIGVLFGLGAAHAMPASVVTVVSVPFPSLIQIVIIAAIAGVLAGVLPARRAAKMDVLRAITTE
jgi:putative ABC transport system permease protein